MEDEQINFKVKDTKAFEKCATCIITEHVNLSDFLSSKSIMKKTLTCPTNAIDIERKEITKDCINCGICWLNYPSIIEMTHKYPNSLKFKKYIKKDKMFIYKWLALCIKNSVGINIKSKGFSRVKRIPLVIKSKKQLYFVKSIYELADIDKANYELNDIIDLISEEISGYEIKKIIIVIEDLNKEIKAEYYVISFDNLYKKIIQNNIRDISEIVN